MGRPPHVLPFCQRPVVPANCRSYLFSSLLILLPMADAVRVRRCLLPFFRRCPLLTRLVAVLSCIAVRCLPHVPPFRQRPAVPAHCRSCFLSSLPISLPGADAVRGRRYPLPFFRRCSLLTRLVAVVAAVDARC